MSHHSEHTEAQQLVPLITESFVPASYAEKAMASLLQLHSELMEEKERRVDLYRRLMEKEQALAELKMYVKLLEEKAAEAEKAKAPEPVVTSTTPLTTHDAKPTTTPSPTVFTRPVTRQPLPRVETAPVPGPAFPRTASPREDGWKSW